MKAQRLTQYILGALLLLIRAIISMLLSSVTDRLDRLEIRIGVVQAECAKITAQLDRIELKLHDLYRELKP